MKVAVTLPGVSVEIDTKALSHWDVVSESLQDSVLSFTDLDVKSLP